MSTVPVKSGAYRLSKADEIIYVGSAKNLSERFSDWSNNPDNHCVKQKGWDNFIWQVTSSHDEARRLELEWYNKFNPVCNLITPPGRA